MDASLFFGGGLAFLIAILGWSDQINGLQEKSREKERKLLEKLNISWSIMRNIVRSTENENPEMKFASLVRFINVRGIPNEDEVRIFHSFEAVDSMRSNLTSFYNKRFWIIFTISIAMLLSGLLLMILGNDEYVVFDMLTFKPISIYIVVWSVLMFYIFYYTYTISRLEEKYRDKMSLLGDQIRELETPETPETQEGE